MDCDEVMYLYVISYVTYVINPSPGINDYYKNSRLSLMVSIADTGH